MVRPLTWFVVLSPSFVFAAPYEPPPCEKWSSDTLTVCDALGEPAGCDEGGGRVDRANKQLYQDDPVTMCKKVFSLSPVPPVNYTSSKPVKACQFTATSNACQPVNSALGFAYCVYDINNDNLIDWNDVSAVGTAVYYGSVTPDPHCYCTPKPDNPHADVDWSTDEITSWESRAVYDRYEFPSSLKKKIAAQNLIFYGYRSDAAFLSPPDPWLQKTHPTQPNAAQVDHIMPRKDSHGCLCGAPTPENAALISRSLNGEMSNKSPRWDYWRSQMYKKYMTCPDPATMEYQGPTPPVAEASDNSQGDEAVDAVALPRVATDDDAPEDDATETGGCSTAGGAGVASIVVALGLLRRRRR